MKKTTSGSAPTPAPRAVPAAPAPARAAKAKAAPRRPFPSKAVGIAAVAVVVLALAGFGLARLLDSGIVRTVRIEAGSGLPSASAFVEDPARAASYASDVGSIDTAIPGRYDLEIAVGDRTYPVVLDVVDTTPPTGTAQDVTAWAGEPVAADAFVAGSSDATAVTVSFKAAPDFATVGVRPVTVVLTDTSGNATDLDATLTVRADTEAPVIAGVKDLSVFIGETLSYRDGVTVTDNKDATVALQIDNSGVDLTKAGTYAVTYAATDAAGNRAEVPATVTVSVKPADYVSEADLYAKVDEIFGTILKPGMTDLDKLSAIFYYVAGHISYTGTSDKSDWVKAAYLGITRGSGDCFNYFALAKAMLTRAGFESIPIERVPAKTHHYWNLVKYNGAWYHYDCLPNLKYYHYVCLLRTDAEVAAFSAAKDAEGLFYVFDHTGIPATPTVPLDIERKVVYG